MRKKFVHINLHNLVCFWLPMFSASWSSAQIWLWLTKRGWEEKYFAFLLVHVILLTKGSLRHAVSTFCRMQFQFWIGKFLSKMQCNAAHFYLGYWNQPWFGPAGSENACIFHMCKWRLATKLKSNLCTTTTLGPHNCGRFWRVVVAQRQVYVIES